MSVIIKERYLEILELLEGRALKSFLNKFNISCPNSKADRRKKLIESLAEETIDGKISLTAFESWIKRWYIPGNKNVFVYSLNNDTVKALKSIENTKLISDKYRENMGSIEDTERPEDPKLIMLEKHCVDGQVNKIELGFVQLGQLRDIDEDNDTIKWTPISYYVYAEINLLEEQLYIWIEPTKKLHKLGQLKKGSFQEVSETYKQIIAAMFNLRFIDNNWISRALYLMWEKDVKVIDENIQSKLEECRPEIKKLVDSHLKKLSIDKFTVEEVVEKISSLYEGLLIRQVGYSTDNKDGFVRRHKVFDGTATVETFNDLPLYNSSSHYGLQVIVNEVGEVNKLEYAWIKMVDDTAEEVITTITVLRGCFVVNFSGYKDEEEIRHVLSGINEYKSQSISRISGEI
ncbi:hypothetical protein [Lysinibacillus sp. BNK-21]|uniref:hypothetical protein n=1 Tax=Lysinibacillus sp. BNK-21 TaxID=3376156 RepID=UPI003B429435